jgi:hypothetical protein
MGYEIQKLVDERWVAAWGRSTRSYPKARSDAEAIAIFERETARVRTPYRLIVRVKFGFWAGERVLATAGPEQESQ